MGIIELINEYGEEYSPYMRGLVNHLPMGQLALFKLKGDLKEVRLYSESFVNRSRIDPIKKEYPNMDSIDKCLGRRDLYEPCLHIIKEKINVDNIHEIISDVLNNYSYGVSSGLFHTTIRLAYAVEGLEFGQSAIDEVARALAYYITAYRESKLFTREIEGTLIFQEISNLVENPYIKDILSQGETLGLKMRFLYNDQNYLQRGFIIKGNEEEKIIGLLKFLLSVYIKTGSIVVLHCITSIHALIVLKKYYDDYSKFIDILTSSIITHLLSIENLVFSPREEEGLEYSWKYIISRLSEVSDVHAIKLTYSTNELYKEYKLPELKRAALKRIGN